MVLGSALVVVGARGRTTQLVSAARTALGRGPATDEQVRARLVIALEAGAPADARVQVEVIDGAVTVRGEVATRDDAASIVDLLGGVGGVREVQGLLHLAVAVPTVLDGTAQRH